jgi:hypothetical protein
MKMFGSERYIKGNFSQFIVTDDEKVTLSIQREVNTLTRQFVRDEIQAN